MSKTTQTKPPLARILSAQGMSDAVRFMPVPRPRAAGELRLVELTPTALAPSAEDNALRQAGDPRIWLGTLVVVLAAALCGCATSLHGRVDTAKLPPLPVLAPSHASPRSSRAVYKVATLNEVTVIIERGNGYVRIHIVAPGSTATNIPAPPVPTPPKNANAVLPSGPHWFATVRHTFPADPPFPEQHTIEHLANNIPVGTLEIQSTVNSWPVFSTIATVDWTDANGTLSYNEELGFWPQHFFRLLLR